MSTTAKTVTVVRHTAEEFDNHLKAQREAQDAAYKAEELANAKASVERYGKQIEEYREGAQILRGHLVSLGDKHAAYSNLNAALSDIVYQGKNAQRYLSQYEQTVDRLEGNSPNTADRI